MLGQSADPGGVYGSRRRADSASNQLGAGVPSLTEGFQAGRLIAQVAARQDREALTTENAQMRVSIYRQRASRKLQRLLLGVGLILVAVVAAGMLWFGPNLFDPPRRVEILPAAPVARSARGDTGTSSATVACSAPIACGQRISATSWSAKFPRRSGKSSTCSDGRRRVDAAASR